VGKHTQCELLRDILTECGYYTILRSYPCYQEEHSYFVRKYLSGEYGDRGNLDEGLVHKFYMLDRFGDYMSDYHDHDDIYGEDEYSDVGDDNCIVIMDRYIGSSLIYQSLDAITTQGSDLKDHLMNMYLDEVVVCEIPKPDITIYLDIPFELQMKLMDNRKVIKSGDNDDIHENAPDKEEYYKRLHERGSEVAKIFKWDVINCNSGNEMLSKERISNMIMNTCISKLGLDIETTYTRNIKL
jgi:dTMP kinase